MLGSLQQIAANKIDGMISVFLRSFNLTRAFSIMDIQDTSAAIYSEAKSEYTKQLVFNFQPVLLRFFLDRYTEAKASQNVIAKTKSSLGEFQESLTQIPEWNLDKVQRETTILLQNIHCDYVEDLITAVFIAHTKILSAIRLNAKPRQKIRITVPKPDHFMHRCLSESSRLLWSNIYLFNDSASSLERQKNMNDVNRLLEEGIVQAIRNLLPVKSILRDSLQEDDDDVQISDDLPLPNAAPEASIESSPVPETPLVEPQAPVEPQVPVEPQAPVQPPSVAVDTSSDVISEPKPLPLVNPVPEQDSDIKTITATKVPSVVSVEKQDTPQNTLVVETEKSVGFTGIDSVFGTVGDAELRETIDEASEEFKIIGDSESLDLSDIEDLDSMEQIKPLSVDDYETI